MFFSRQKEQLEDIHSKSVRICYQLERQENALAFIDKLLCKVLSLREAFAKKEKELLLQSLEQCYVQNCVPKVTNDNGNMTLELSVTSLPCSMTQETLFDEEGKTIGVKYKLQWKVCEPC